MTTGIDYATEYISLRPDENTRSIAEIVTEIKNNGYSNLTNVEIENYIAYEKSLTEKEQQRKFQQQQTNAQIDALNDFIEEQKRLRDERRKEERNGQA